MRRDVLSRSLRVAALVGTVLVAINYADRLLAGDVAPRDWLKMAVTYFVPFCVSTHGSVSALRSQRVRDAR